jgi:hypothetical protein
MMRAEIPQERASAEDYLEAFKIILPATLEIKRTEGMVLPKECQRASEAFGSC